VRHLLLLLCLAGFSVPAQDIHKCVSGKEITYQSEPCGPGQTYAKTWGTEVSSSPAYGKVRPSPRPAVDPGYLARQARRARNGAGPGTVIQPASGSQTNCEDVKRMRDAYLESDHGRNAGYDGRRAWQDRVYDACK